MALLNIIDGDFTTPKEVEGSGVLYVDEITRSKVLSRMYCVERTFYTPLLTDDLTPIPDYQYPTCVLIEERPSQAVGRMLFFNRVYAEIPVARSEYRLVAFAQPGVSQAQISQFSRLPIAWNQYWGAQPYTRAALASVAYSYSTNPSSFVVPEQTRITYKGAPVDFVGDVYAYTGNRTVITGPITGLSQSDGQIIFEPAWTLEGSTVPPRMPASWVLDVNIERWRGTIWEMTVVTVPTIATTPAS